MMNGKVHTCAHQALSLGVSQWASVYSSVGMVASGGSLAGTMSVSEIATCPLPVLSGCPVSGISDSTEGEPCFCHIWASRVF